MTNVNRPTAEEINSSIFAQIAQHVALNGEIININDTAEWLKNHPEFHCDSDDISHESKCILCMPIVDGSKRVIGVLVYVHANGVQFTNCEISIFEAFAIFCGLGIHNMTQYERRVNIGLLCAKLLPDNSYLQCMQVDGEAESGFGVSVISRDRQPRPDHDAGQSAHSERRGLQTVQFQVYW